MASGPTKWWGTRKGQVDAEEHDAKKGVIGCGGSENAPPHIHPLPRPIPPSRPMRTCAPTCSTGMSVKAGEPVQSSESRKRALVSPADETSSSASNFANSPCRVAGAGQSAQPKLVETHSPTHT
ncbi:hypothetical protein BST61_g2248 [Cercospora zeina]